MTTINLSVTATAGIGLDTVVELAAQLRVDSPLAQVLQHAGHRLEVVPVLVPDEECHRSHSPTSATGRGSRDVRDRLITRQSGELPQLVAETAGQQAGDDQAPVTSPADDNPAHEN